ncbi:MAG: regulatory signaling modulator protein AmpE [Rhodocyclaceae bacterium]|nr:regulatory signaling modulator protein AmpE [Rhodocyclaceae bacterium]
MTLLALLIALLLTRLLPSRHGADLPRLVETVGARLAAVLDGQAYAVVAWWLVLGVVGGLGWLVSALLRDIHPILGLGFDVAVLYGTLGSARDTAAYGLVHKALQEDDVPGAARALSRWMGGECALNDADQIARVAIERALLSAHRNVFGVSFWFVLMPGPGGALAYALLASLARDWPVAGGPAPASWRVLDSLDWLPARMTALAYSVAGNFEDAAYCWRSQARQWHNEIEGILISSGAGALGVKLGRPIQCGGRTVSRPELGVGAEACPDLLQSAVELVWRTLVLCLALLALFSVAGWVSG